MPEQNKDTVTILHRFSIIPKPGHMEPFLKLWYQEAGLRQRYGFNVLFANVDDECKFTWCYSYDGDIAAAEKRFNDDKERVALAAEARTHVRKNDTVRRVRQEFMSKATEDSIKGKTTVMRRYRIKPGGWDGFLDAWHRIVPMREHYGFKCLFALSDIEDYMFTWAFSYDGEYKNFGEMQKPYYADPKRVELEVVSDYITDLKLTSARQLLIP